MLLLICLCRCNPWLQPLNEETPSLYRAKKDTQRAASASLLPSTVWVHSHLVKWCMPVCKQAVDSRTNKRNKREAYQCLVLTR